MSDAPQYPAGWYPDPQNPSIVRWWDGYRWTEAWHPAPAAAPAPPAYRAPAQPVQSAQPAQPAPATARPPVYEAPAAPTPPANEAPGVHDAPVIHDAPAVADAPATPARDEPPASAAPVEEPSATRPAPAEAAAPPAPAKPPAPAASIPPLLPPVPPAPAAPHTASAAAAPPTAPAAAAPYSAPTANAPYPAPATTATATANAHYPAPATTATATAPATGGEAYRSIRTSTVWIWLVVLLPLLNLLSYVLLDWRGYIEDVVATSVQPGTGSQSWVVTWTFGSLAIATFGYVVTAAQIVFAFLDWRTLRARGVEKPFHWAWIFLALVITNGVYVIGRGVVLRRRTGAGLAPVWAWIAVTAISWIIAIVFAVVLFNEVFAILTREGLLTP